MFKLINLFLKRIMDLLGSFIGLILLSPLFLIVTIAIKIDSRGPVFFKQERLGKKGKVFKIWKFRTMVVNAENIGDGLTVKSDDDNRITKVGKFLRKTSLDEIPQLINVFIGNMSFVGPRPPVSYFPYDGYKNYPKWMKDRFLMKPGITGLAQILYRNNANWDQRIFLDVKYIVKFNVLLDIKLLIQTVFKIFKKESVYGTTNLNKWSQPPLKFNGGYLNRIEPWDFNKYYKWRNDKEVFYYLGGGYQKTSKNKMKEIFKSMLKDNENIRYTILNNNFKQLGMIAFYNKNEEWEIGLYIGDKSEQGKGYASKAYLIAEEEIKKHFNITHFNLFVVYENKKAINLWKKLGFIVVEDFNETRIIENKKHKLIKMRKKVSR